jgi:hypothetical protein
VIAKGAWKNRTKTATNPYDLKLEKLKVLIRLFDYHNDTALVLKGIAIAGFRELSASEEIQLRDNDKTASHLITMIMEFE